MSALSAVQLEPFLLGQRRYEYCDYKHAQDGRHKVSLRLFGSKVAPPPAVAMVARAVTVGAAAWSTWRHLVMYDDKFEKHYKNKYILKIINNNSKILSF